MRKFILVSLAFVLFHPADGQTFVNNGATVAVTPGAVMIVRTNGTAGSGSLENMPATSSASIFRNAGQVTIEGDFQNDPNATADGFGSNTGKYRVMANWSNSGTFTADSSTVLLYGPLPQEIEGSNPTRFYNLIDSNTGVKTQNNIDAYVANTLNIYSVEHATGDNRLVVLNPDPHAIVVDNTTDAFVSSTHEGRLVRYTNQKAEYIFPTGINAGGTAKIREVSVSPADAALTRMYYARYADYNNGNTTSQDLYDTASKAGTITKVNDAYYHLVTSSDTVSPADLAVYFDPAADGAWQGLGRWQSVPQWQDLLNSVTVSSTNGSQRMKMVKSAWLPSLDSAYALIDTISIKTPFNFPNVFVADGVGIPIENTTFGIINVGDQVTLEGLSVFNRWGEMVFDKKRDGSDNWNGHFNGKLAAQGNYVYRAVVRNNATGKEYPLVTGNVALLW